MPRGTELEEPCSWGPRQAHFTDGEREALRGGGRPFWHRQQIRSKGSSRSTQWALSGRLMQHVPLQKPPSSHGAPWGALAAARCWQPFPPLLAHASRAGKKGPLARHISMGADDVKGLLAL